MDSKLCGECHKDIYEEWNSSMHHFGSFNNPAKISDRTVNLWSRTLGAVPGSRLLLKGKSLDQHARLMQARFAAANSDLAQTPFKFEVKPGMEPIAIDVKK